MEVSEHDSWPSFSLFPSDGRWKSTGQKRTHKNGSDRPVSCMAGAPLKKYNNHMAL